MSYVLCLVFIHNYRSQACCYFTEIIFVSVKEIHNTFNRTFLHLKLVFQISSQENWVCFMCSGETIRLLKRRENWQERLREIFLTDEEDEYV